MNGESSPPAAQSTIVSSRKVDQRLVRRRRGRSLRSPRADRATCGVVEGGAGRGREQHAPVDPREGSVGRRGFRRTTIPTRANSAGGSASRAVRGSAPETPLPRARWTVAFPVPAQHQPDCCAQGARHRQWSSAAEPGAHQSSTPASRPRFKSTTEKELAVAQVRDLAGLVAARVVDADLRADVALVVDLEHLRPRRARRASPRSSRSGEVALVVEGDEQVARQRSASTSRAQRLARCAGLRVEVGLFVVAAVDALACAMP